MGTPLKNGYVACEISIGEPSKIFVLMLYCIVVLYRYTVSRYTESLYCIVSRYIYNIYIIYLLHCTIHSARTLSRWGLESSNVKQQLSR